MEFFSQESRSSEKTEPLVHGIWSKSSSLTQYITRANTSYIAAQAVGQKRPPVSWLTAKWNLARMWPPLPPYVFLLWCLIKHKTTCVSSELLNGVEVILLKLRWRKWSCISAVPTTTIFPQRIIEEKETRVLSGIKLGLKQSVTDSLRVLLRRARLKYK